MPDDNLYIIRPQAGGSGSSQDNCITLTVGSLANPLDLGEVAAVAAVIAAEAGTQILYMNSPSTGCAPNQYTYEKQPNGTVCLLALTRDSIAPSIQNAFLVPGSQDLDNEIFDFHLDANGVPDGTYDAVVRGTLIGGGDGSLPVTTANFGMDSTLSFAGLDPEEPIWVDVEIVDCDGRTSQYSFPISLVSLCYPKAYDEATIASATAAENTVPFGCGDQSPGVQDANDGIIGIVSWDETNSNHVNSGSYCATGNEADNYVIGKTGASPTSPAELDFTMTRPVSNFCFVLNDLEDIGGGQVDELTITAMNNGTPVTITATILTGTAIITGNGTATLNVKGSSTAAHSSENTVMICMDGAVDAIHMETGLNTQTGIGIGKPTYIDTAFNTNSDALLWYENQVSEDLRCYGDVIIGATGNVWMFATENGVDTIIRLGGADCDLISSSCFDQESTNSLSASGPNDKWYVPRHPQAAIASLIADFTTGDVTMFVVGKKGQSGFHYEYAYISHIYGAAITKSGETPSEVSLPDFDGLQSSFTFSSITPSLSDGDIFRHEIWSGPNTTSGSTRLDRFSMRYEFISVFKDGSPLLWSNNTTIDPSEFSFDWDGVTYANQTDFVNAVKAIYPFLNVDNEGFYGFINPEFSDIPIRLDVTTP